MLLPCGLAALVRSATPAAPRLRGRRPDVRTRPHGRPCRCAGCRPERSGFAADLVTQLLLDEKRLSASSRRQAYPLDYPWVVARSESGHLFDLPAMHGSRRVNLCLAWRQWQLALLLFARGSSGSLQRSTPHRSPGSRGHANEHGPDFGLVAYGSSLVAAALSARDRVVRGRSGQPILRPTASFTEIGTSNRPSVR